MSSGCAPSPGQGPPLISERAARRIRRRRNGSGYGTTARSTKATIDDDSLAMSQDRRPSEQELPSREPAFASATARRSEIVKNLRFSDPGVHQLSTKTFRKAQEHLPAYLHRRSVIRHGGHVVGAEKLRHVIEASTFVGQLSGHMQSL